MVSVITDITKRLGRKQEQIQRLEKEIKDRTDSIKELKKLKAYLKMEKKEEKILQDFADRCGGEEEGTKIREIERNLTDGSIDAILWNSAIEYAITEGRSIIEVYHSLGGGRPPTTRTPFVRGEETE